MTAAVIPLFLLYIYKRFTALNFAVLVIMVNFGCGKHTRESRQGALGTKQDIYE